MSWDYATLDQLGTISRGKSKHRPRNDKKLFGGKYPFIQTADVKSAGLYLTEFSEMEYYHRTQHYGLKFLRIACLSF